LTHWFLLAFLVTYGTIGSDFRLAIAYVLKLADSFVYSLLIAVLCFLHCISWHRCLSYWSDGVPDMVRSHQPPHTSVKSTAFVLYEGIANLR